MSMRIGTSNSDRRVITFKNTDGAVAGTLSISKPGIKKKKRLQYNIREISSQILAAKTSGSASRVLIAARGKVAMLKRKWKNSDYDEKELERAIIHAQKMVRIARKRMKHLKEEESAKQQGFCLTETDENIIQAEYKEKEEPEVELSREKLEELMQKFQELMEELETETGLDEFAEELMGGIQEDISPEELENLKKKHRAEELRDIMEADMKYLKALFDELQKEKESNGSPGVSLQLSGIEIPVQVTETPVITEGRNVDESV
ncbi:MAG: hypothetical protein J6C64_13705 [Lachnospiraceae bacterium]|nr:hypothetical protein [Lachnospiraceae bacterium]